MFDRILMLLEIILLGVVVWQGEWVRYYERRVFEMNAERFEERKQWRTQKKQQQLKKSVPDAIVAEKSLSSDTINAAPPMVTMVSANPVSTKTTASAAKSINENSTNSTCD